MPCFLLSCFLVPPARFFGIRFLSARYLRWSLLQYILNYFSFSFSLPLSPKRRKRIPKTEHFWILHVCLPKVMWLIAHFNLWCVIGTNHIQTVLVTVVTCCPASLSLQANFFFLMAATHLGVKSLNGLVYSLLYLCYYLLYTLVYTSGLCSGVSILPLVFAICFVSQFTLQLIPMASMLLNGMLCGCGQKLWYYTIHSKVQWNEQMFEWDNICPPVMFSHISCSKSRYMHSATSIFQTSWDQKRFG